MNQKIIILDWLAAQIEKGQLHQVRMADTAAVVKVSKKTLYKLFRDKASMMESALIYHLEKLKDEIKLIKEQKKSLSCRLTQIGVVIFDGLHQIYKEDRHYFDKHLEGNPLRDFFHSYLTKALNDLLEESTEKGNYFDQQTKKEIIQKILLDIHVMLEFGQSLVAKHGKEKVFCSISYKYLDQWQFTT